jgi:hypothetical protein
MMPRPRTPKDDDVGSLEAVVEEIEEAAEEIED